MLAERCVHLVVVSFAVIGVTIIAPTIISAINVEAQESSKSIIHSSDSGVSLAGGISSSSLVTGVKVTALNYTDGKSLSVNLSYYGNDTTPDVTLIATALTATSAEVNSFLSSILRNTPENNNDTNTYNMNGNKTMTGHSYPSFAKVLAGSIAVKGGWRSPLAVSIPLQGNTTLSESNIASVQLLPSISTLTENREGPND